MAKRAELRTHLHVGELVLCTGYRLRSESSGGRRGVPQGRPVRSPDRAKQGYLKYGQVASRILYRSYIDQQISPCFLQDFQSEWEKDQMQKSYKGVKSEKCCEVVTVGRRAARGGEIRSHQTSSKVVATAPHVFIEHH